jgi:hypothetical protein
VPCARLILFHAVAPPEKPFDQEKAVSAPLLKLVYDTTDAVPLLAFVHKGSVLDRAISNSRVLIIMESIVTVGAEGEVIVDAETTENAA